MSPSIEVLAFIFVVIVIGFAAARLALLKPQTGVSLAEFTFSIAIPFLLFRTMSNANFGSSLPILLWLVYFSSAALAWAAGQGVVRLLFSMDSRTSVVGGLAASFANLVQLGIPLIYGLYGQMGLDLLTFIVAINLPIMMVLSTVLMERTRLKAAQPASSSGALRQLARNLIRNPLIIAIALGIAWRFAGTPLPALGARVVDAFANVANTVALFAMGFSLATLGLKGNLLPAFALSAVKLLVMPGAALAFALLAQLPDFSVYVVVTTASLATGINPFLIASHFGTGQALASNTIGLSTALSFLTTGLWLTVTHLVLG